MSLTSLADAPLLSKPIAGPLLPKPRALSSPKLKEDQAAIDALFGEDTDRQMDKTHSERSRLFSSRELPNPARNLDLKRNTADSEAQKLHVAAFPTLPALNQQPGYIFKTIQPKQDDSLFSKTRDANDVLAGFLADSTAAIPANKPANLELQKEQREDFKSKWKSYLPQPVMRLPTFISPSLSSESTHHFTDSLESVVPSTKSASDHSNFPKKPSIVPDLKDEDWNTKDVLSLLPDESTEPMKEGAFSVNSSISPATSCPDVEEESSDFGGYQPSCLSLSVATQRKHFTAFFSQSENLDRKEKTTVPQDEGPCNEQESNSPINACKTTPTPVQDSTAEKVPVKTYFTSVSRETATDDKPDLTAVKLPVNKCSTSISRETATDEKPDYLVEVLKLRDENLVLKEEIMKIEAEKLKLEKEFLEEELAYEPQGANQADLEREEAQKIAEDLGLELLSVKQSLCLTEEKIDCMKKVHEDEIEMLKSMHEKELEMKEKQLCMEKAYLVERKDAMEAFSQLLSKADGWSARIDELHRSMLHEERTRPLEKSAWIGNIESMVSDHECSLQMLEKRSIEVCNQLEKVAIMLDNARKDMENLQKQEEERMNKTHNQLQAFHDIMQREHEQTLECQTTLKEKQEQIHDPGVQEQHLLLTSFLEEKKDLEAERETVLCMKEELLQADATLRKQLHAHAVRMQAEAEEMARQKRDLEHARNLAAEIAVEVESSRRELDVYKTMFDRTTPEIQHGQKSLTAHLAAQNLPNYERNLELIRSFRSRRKLHGRPYSSADVYRSFSFGLNLLDNHRMFQAGGSVLRGVDEDPCYLRSQEDFLMQAEKSLEGMSAS